MKRSQFLVVAAVVPLLFGLVMMFVPDVMLANSLVAAADSNTRAVTQWVGFAVFSVAVITFLSRDDPGSPALKGVLIGNAIFHALGIGFDTYHYMSGLMTASGLVSGLVPHALLAIGCGYFVATLPDQSPLV